MAPTEDWRIEAAGLALALEMGRASLSEAVSWADALIVRQDEPDDRLIELSLARTLNDAIGHLNAVARDVGLDDRVMAFLDRLLPLERIEPGDADDLAFRLARLYDGEGADSKIGTCLHHHDDALHMAIEGAYGSLDACARRLLDDVDALLAEWRAGVMDGR